MVYEVEDFHESFVYYCLYDDGWVQLYERLYTYGEAESSRPYGPLWEHHLYMLFPLGVQHLIMGFVFHSERSMRSAVFRNFAVLDIPSDVEEPILYDD